MIRRDRRATRSGRALDERSLCLGLGSERRSAISTFSNISLRSLSTSGVNFRVKFTPRRNTTSKTPPLEANMNRAYVAIVTLLALSPAALGQGRTPNRVSRQAIARRQRNNVPLSRQPLRPKREQLRDGDVAAGLGPEPRPSRLRLLQQLERELTRRPSGIGHDQRAIGRSNPNIQIVRRDYTSR